MFSPRPLKSAPRTPLLGRLPPDPNYLFPFAPISLHTRLSRKLNLDALQRCDICLIFTCHSITDSGMSYVRKGAWKINPGKADTLPEEKSTQGMRPAHDWTRLVLYDYTCQLKDHCRRFATMIPEGCFPCLLLWGALYQSKCSSMSFQQVQLKYSWAKKSTIKTNFTFLCIYWVCFNSPIICKTQQYLSHLWEICKLLPHLLFSIKF